MANLIKRIATDDGEAQIDYNALANLPTIPSKTSQLTNDSDFATNESVRNEVADLVESAPETLDTLNELAQALGDDPNFATTVATELGKKANSADLATVAISGKYSDLSNKPILSYGLDDDGNLRVTLVKTEPEYQFSAIKNKIKIYGRSLDIVDGIACDFSASGIEFNAYLAGDIKMVVNSNGTSYYTLYIDGVRQVNRLMFTNGTAEYTIATELSEGNHNIKLIKQTMIAHSSSAFISLIINGGVLARPLKNDLLIEFVGDSITCGYALVDGYSSNNVGTAAYMDATKSFAYLTAEQLEADESFICNSGWAVLPSAPGEVNGCIPAIYPNTSYVRSTELYNPTRTADIVVIHLGTNDLWHRAETYPTEFTEAAKQFIRDVKVMNPNAKVIWAYGSMMNGSNLTGFEEKIRTAINYFGGAAAGYYMVQLPTNTSGGGSHPSAAAHVESANILTEFIRNNILKEEL